VVGGGLGFFKEGPKEDMGSGMGAFEFRVLRMHGGKAAAPVDEKNLDLSNITSRI